MQYKHNHIKLKAQTPIQILILGFLLLLPLLHHAQDGSKLIQIISANSLESDEVYGKRLIGNVTLLHEGTYMRCDSAYLEPDSNYFHGYGRVRVTKGDSLKAFSEEMVYNGNTKKGQLIRNVKIIQGDATLKTDMLYYDKGSNLSYYLTGGEVVQEGARLTSKKGYYHQDEGYFSFREDVVMIDQDFRLESDTLQYYPDSKRAKIQGPTQIVSDQDSIYSEEGDFFTETKIGHFSKNAVVKSVDQDLYADSIYFNKMDSIGEAYGHVRMLDKKENVWIHGETAKQNQKQKRAIVYDRAEMLQIDEEDTLFLHADTLRFVELPAGKEIYAYRHVKFYREDIQGKCDSINFAFSDSLMKMYGSPVLWSDENQISSDTINLLIYESKIHELQLFKNSFIISQYDEERYNQISGKKMTGFFKDNKIVRFDVFGNGQSIYWAEDDDKKLIGVNEIECSDIVIYLDDNKIQKIKFIEKPDALFSPPGDKNPQELRLKGFFWDDSNRPLKREDIFK